MRLWVCLKRKSKKSKNCPCFCTVNVITLMRMTMLIKQPVSSFSDGNEKKQSISASAKCMQDICWNGCIVSLKKYHEFLMIGLCEFNRLIWIFWFKSLAYCLIFMRICVYDTYISIVLHMKHISFFSVALWNFMKAWLTKRKRIGWTDYRGGTYGIFLCCYPLLKSAVSNNCP